MLERNPKHKNVSTVNYKVWCWIRHLALSHSYAKDITHLTSHLNIHTFDTDVKRRVKHVSLWNWLVFHFQENPR
jgi:hypothetical protein